MPTAGERARVGAARAGEATAAAGTRQGRRPRTLKILFVCGTPGSGKTFATDTVLAVDYDVATVSMDRIYRQAQTHACISHPSGKRYGVYGVARALRTDGHFTPDVAERFLAKFDELVSQRIDNAVSWGVDLVFEGYSLKFADEVERIMEAARAAAPARVRAARVHLRPSRRQWSRNWKAKRGTVQEISRATYLRRTAAPQAIPGLDDHTAAGAHELKKVAKAAQLKRHKWDQGFSAGPISTGGSSRAAEKVGLILDRDIVGKRVLDACCSTGVRAILLKDRGASKVVGVERSPVKHCKSRELKKVLRRHAAMDTHVSFRLGDMLTTVPELRAFDTTVFFGALHCFSDCEQALGLLAAATREALYVELSFAAGWHDAAGHPGEVRPSLRSRTGTAIQMGDPEMILGVMGRCMPSFGLEERTPISPPGRKLSPRREVWRLRRG